MARVADWAYYALTRGLVLTTIYLTGTFSVNMYRGVSWHNAQKKLEAEQTAEQGQ